MAATHTHARTRAHTHARAQARARRLVTTHADVVISLVAVSVYMYVCVCVFVDIWAVTKSAGSKLSSITMSAPAAIASSASSAVPHSTSIFRAKPHTARACFTAFVIEPCDQMWLSFNITLGCRSMFHGNGEANIKVQPYESEGGEGGEGGRGSERREGGASYPHH